MDIGDDGFAIVRRDKNGFPTRTGFIPVPPPVPGVVVDLRAVAKEAEQMMADNPELRPKFDPSQSDKMQVNPIFAQLMQKQGGEMNA